VALLRAAQHLGLRARSGWRGAHTLVIGLWDAEEFGLVGSTEWAEANAERLRRCGLAYVNADAAVSGTRFSASGTPGMLGVLRRVLERIDIPADAEAGASLWDGWAEGQEQGPRLGLPGSGSDFAVFLHHLSLPVLDVGFGGNSGGQYHTPFDDFPMMDRHLDPGWVGHELAGRFLAELLAELAESPGGGFDTVEAATEMARRIRQPAEGREGEDLAWLGEERAEALAQAFERLAGTAAEWLESVGPVTGDPGFYRRLEAGAGLPGRPWFRNRLWTPGLETGYRSELLPSLRSAALEGEAALEREHGDLLLAIERLRAAWSPGDEP
jgi:N-acetylated-alpha-linked acidic dipeptidase